MQPAPNGVGAGEKDVLAPTPVHVLIIEEAVADAELMVAELRRAGFGPDWRRVVTEAEYVDLLGPGPMSSSPTTGCRPSAPGALSRSCGSASCAFRSSSCPARSARKLPWR